MLLMHQLRKTVCLFMTQIVRNFLAGRCGSVVVREKFNRIRKVWVGGPGSTLGCDFLSF